MERRTFIETVLKAGASIILLPSIVLPRNIFSEGPPLITTMVETWHNTRFYYRIMSPHQRASTDIEVHSLTELFAWAAKKTDSNVVIFKKDLTIDIPKYNSGYGKVLPFSGKHLSFPEQAPNQYKNYISGRETKNPSDLLHIRNLKDLTWDLLTCPSCMIPGLNALDALREEYGMLMVDLYEKIIEDHKTRFNNPKFLPAIVNVWAPHEFCGGILGSNEPTDVPQKWQDYTHGGNIQIDVVDIQPRT